MVDACTELPKGCLELECGLCVNEKYMSVVNYTRFFCFVLGLSVTAE